MFCKIIPSPLGHLKLVANATGLVAVLWENDPPQRVKLGEMTADEHHPILTQTQRELDEYFTKKRKHFTVPLAMIGTDFQKQVWRALVAIPFGETRSYGAIARQVGSERAFRAVGAANGRNPVSIIVPCHRAVGANGSLTGFAGGLAAKRFLLDLEGTELRLAG